MDRTGYELPDDLKAFTAGQEDPFQLLRDDVSAALLFGLGVMILIFWPYL